MASQQVLEELVVAHADTSNRITRNTLGHVVVNNSLGIAVKTTYDNTKTNGIITKIAGLLTTAARSLVRDVDPTNDLIYLRIATSKFEYLVAPEDEFTIVVCQ